MKCRQHFSLILPGSKEDELSGSPKPHSSATAGLRFCASPGMLGSLGLGGGFFRVITNTTIPTMISSTKPPAPAAFSGFALHVASFNQSPQMSTTFPSSSQFMCFLHSSAPATSVKVPSSQLLQAEAPSPLENVPSLHLVASFAPAVLTSEPLGAFSQVSVPFSAQNVPALHFSSVTDAIALTNIPCPARVQSVIPSTHAKLPA